MARLPNGAVIGPYKIVGDIDSDGHTRGGQGEFGITYCAKPVRGVGQMVAIKEFFPGKMARRGRGNTVVITGDAEAHQAYKEGIAEFEREAEALDRFDHPNIVKVIGFTEKNNTAYIVMEWIPGETLAKAVGSRKGPQRLMTVDQLKPILVALLDALREIHTAEPQLLHRDIKPGNIMLRERDSSPVLIDFGAARQITAGATQQLTTILTPGYAPYEQYVIPSDQFEEEFGTPSPDDLDKLPKQGPPTDLYALGAVCYFALTGQAPADAITRRINSGSYRPIETRMANPPESPSELEAWRHFLRLIDRALMMEPKDRFQSASQWLAALAETPSATAPKSVPATQNSDSKARALWPIGAVAGVGLIGLAVASAYNGGGSNYTFNNYSDEDYNVTDNMVENTTMGNVSAWGDVANSTDYNTSVPTESEESTVSNSTVTSNSIAYEPPPKSYTPTPTPSPTYYPKPTPRPTPTKNPNHRIWFVNQCRKAVYVYFRWYNQNEEWVNSGPWYRSANSAGAIPNLLTRFNMVYYYAKIDGGGWHWHGDSNQTVNGTTYQMDTYTMSEDSDGDYRITISCDAYTGS